MAKSAITPKSQQTLTRMFHELEANPPKVLAKTRKKKGAKQANRQRVAIAFSKARRAGASV
jgi:hypothetical protein